MAKVKERKPINQDDDPISIVDECVAQADITDLKLTWEYVQEFLRGNHLVYLDRHSKKIIHLEDGAIIPGTDKEIAGTVNAPKDPHITTLDNGITAKAYANIPFLLPQVNGATSEDEDEDAALNSSHLLMYYYRANNEEELYKRIVGWLKPAGNVYFKDYWDKRSGDYAMNPQTQTPLTDKNGNPIRVGDITSQINPPQRMLIPPGIPYDEDLPWLGEENAKPVDDIYDIWGVKVEEETNLEDLNSLNSYDSGIYGYGQQLKPLKGHARVREIYFRPTSQRPLGRLIIVCNKQVLYDDVWDKALTSKYPDEWHPYTHIGYKRIEGDYWYKSQFEYLVDLQIQLNKLFKQIMDALKKIKGAWIDQEGAVDWDTVNWDEEGNIHITYSKDTTVAPSFVTIQIAINQLAEEYNNIIQRMNDIAANYEVSRGQNIPGVTSGKQVQSLQAANSLQVSPLLGGIAAGYINHWQKVLRLCAVHYENTGRLIKVTGAENEAIAFTFTPDQIKSDDIVIANGPWFFMDPQQRMAKVDQLFQSGALGDPRNPATQKRYLWLQGIGGGLEEVFAEYTADIRMAKAENMLFKQGKLEETDPALINSSPQMQQYKLVLQEWQQKKQVHDGAVQEALKGNVTAEQMATVPPPPDPGPEPSQPKIYRMARPYEDHALHVQILNQLRKSTRFENLCQQNPELRMATDFHEKSHNQYLAKSMPTPPPSQLDIQKSKNVTQILGDLISAYAKNGSNLELDQALNQITVPQLIQLLSGQLPQQPSPPTGGGLNIPAPPPDGNPG